MSNDANQPGRMLPLGSILGTLQAAYRLADKAPWPVWSGSTRNPVQFQPMPKRQAVRLWHDARRLERQTRKPGHQDGAIGRNGLAVLYAMLFDFLNHRTGQLDPTRATLARAACISIRSVDRGLAALKAAGVLEWVRRCEASIEDGIYRLRQKASAYFIKAQKSWHGFWQPPEAPAPYPEALGLMPPLPDSMEMAATVRAQGGSVAAQIAALEGDPRDDLAASLARLTKAFHSRKP